MKNSLVLLAILLIVPISNLQGQDSLSSITIISIENDISLKKLRLNYQLPSAKNDFYDVFLQIITEKNQSVKLNKKSISGDIGAGVTPGKKSITISYGSLKIDKIRLQLKAAELGSGDGIFSKKVDSVSIKKYLSRIVELRKSKANSFAKKNVKSYLIDELRKFNIDVKQNNFTSEGRYYTNIIAHFPGRQTEKYIICAHYDVHANSPGADDNGSGTAALLEIARILSNQKLLYDIDLIFFDGEEDGLLGSKKYVSFLTRNTQIKGVINLDMIGYSDDRPETQALGIEFRNIFPMSEKLIATDSSRGNFLFSLANKASEELLKDFEKVVNNEVEDLKLLPLVAPNAEAASTYPLSGSDHHAFWTKGYKALFLSDGWSMRNPHYHSKSDDLSTINFSFLSRTVSAVIAFIHKKAISAKILEIDKPVNLLSGS